LAHEERRGVIPGILQVLEGGKAGHLSFRELKKEAEDTMINGRNNNNGGERGGKETKRFTNGEGLRRQKTA